MPVLCDIRQLNTLEVMCLKGGELQLYLAGYYLIVHCNSQNYFFNEKKEKWKQKDTHHTKENILPSILDYFSCYLFLSAPLFPFHFPHHDVNHRQHMHKRLDFIQSTFKIYIFCRDSLKKIKHHQICRPYHKETAIRKRVKQNEDELSRHIFQMIHVNLIDGRICTAMILPCSSTCLGLLSESSQVSKAQINAHMKTFALSIKDVST